MAPVNKKGGTFRSNKIKPSTPSRNNFVKPGSSRNDRRTEKKPTASPGNFFIKPKSSTNDQKKPTISSKTPKANGNEKVRKATTSSSSGDFYVKLHPSDNPEKTDRQPGREKKPFDKKKWRLQKYSKKYKVQQWQDKRKKAIMHEYYKQIDDDQPKLDVKKIYEQEEDEEEGDLNEGENLNDRNDVRRTVESKIRTSEVSFHTEDETPVDPAPKNSKFRKRRARLGVKEEFERIKQEKVKKKEEAEKKKLEREEERRKHRLERLDKTRKLNKRTKKGQPVMKERMELLLEQIQRNLQK